MKTRIVKLTDSECGHILTLIAVNERQGWYSSNRRQWRARSKRIEKKLLKAASREGKS